MPLYNYTCKACDTTFEQIVPAKAADAVECRECGSTATARLFSLPAKPLSAPAATNCRGDGPPCGRAMCGRRAVGGS